MTRQLVGLAGLFGCFCFLSLAPLAAQGTEAEPFFTRMAASDADSAAAPADDPQGLSPLNRADTTQTTDYPIRVNIPYSKREFAKDLVMDQMTIWQSPLHVKKDDLRWMLPVGLATAALLPYDREASESLRGRFEGGSLKLSMAGGPTNMATSAVLFGIGHFTHKPHLRDTGLLGMRAVTNTWLTVQTIKIATNRERPKEDGLEQDGGFWRGGKSFPSGHSASTWALATVIAEQYSEKPWLRFGAYAFAAGISMSRVSGQKHFPSDVLIGGVIGHLIGRHVVRSWRKRKAMHAFRMTRLEDPSPDQ